MIRQHFFRIIHLRSKIITASLVRMKLHHQTAMRLGYIVFSGARFKTQNIISLAHGNAIAELRLFRSGLKWIDQSVYLPNRHVRGQYRLVIHELLPGLIRSPEFGRDSLLYSMVWNRVQFHRTKLQ